MIEAQVTITDSIDKITTQHSDCLWKIEKTIEEKIEIIDGTAEGTNEDSETARKAIKDAWNNTYRQARIKFARNKKLFENKVKEDKAKPRQSKAKRLAEQQQYFFPPETGEEKQSSSSKGLKM